jgi:hypothetical protein
MLGPNLVKVSESAFVAVWGTRTMSGEALHIPDRILNHALGMRSLLIVIVAYVALSMVGVRPHFAPRPSRPLPAVNVP